MCLFQFEAQDVLVPYHMQSKPTKKKGGSSILLSNSKNYCSPQLKGDIKEIIQAANRFNSYLFILTYLL